MLLRQLSGQPRDDGNQAQQGWGRAGNRRPLPLALGLHTQRGAGLLPRDFQAPPEDKPRQNLDRVHRQVGAQQGLGLEVGLRIAHQHPANRQWRHARVRPQSRRSSDLHHALPVAIPAADRHRGPACRHIAQPWGQRGPALALQTRPAILSWLAGWSGLIQGGIQPQAGDAQTDGPTDAAATTAS